MKDEKNITKVAEPKTAEKNETKKVTLPSRASVLDTILLAGGTFEELVAKADAAAVPLKTKIKHYTASLFATHMRYRETKKPGFFNSVKVTETGIFPVSKK
jgi:hypothetical protein